MLAPFQILMICDHSPSSSFFRCDGECCVRTRKDAYRNVRKSEDAYAEMSGKVLGNRNTIKTNLPHTETFEHWQPGQEQSLFRSF